MLFTDKMNQNEYYIEYLTSVSQLKHPGIYSVWSMSENFCPGFLDWSTGDYSIQVISHSYDQYGIRFGSMIVSSARFTRKIWVIRIWDYVPIEPMKLVNDLPEAFAITLNEQKCTNGGMWATRVGNLIQISFYTELKSTVPAWSSIELGTLSEISVATMGGMCFTQDNGLAHYTVVEYGTNKLFLQTKGHSASGWIYGFCFAANNRI